jgi:phosphoglucomutase
MTGAKVENYLLYLSRLYFIKLVQFNTVSGSIKIYNNLSREYGASYERIEAKATTEQKEKLKNLSSSEIKHKELAGENIDILLIKA